MQKIKGFFQECIAELQPSGWFSDAMFDDLDAVIEMYTIEIMDAEELVELDEDHEWFQDMLPYHFSGLLALDRNHCAHINMKKAGIEGGRGYYENLVHGLVACFAENVSTNESWTPNQDGWAEIVPVQLTAELTPYWAPGKSAEGVATEEQAFTPLHNWTDLIFIEQLLSRLLGEKMEQMMTRVGIDEEWALFIFPPTQAAASALSKFEKRRLKKPNKSEFWTQRITPLPQPTKQNLTDVMRAAGREVHTNNDSLVETKTPQKFQLKPLNILGLLCIVIFLIFANSEWAERLLSNQ